MFPRFRWSLLLRPPRRLDSIELTADADAVSRRLLRRSERPRALSLYDDTGLRALHGRDPPPFAPPRPK